MVERKDIIKALAPSEEYIYLRHLDNMDKLNKDSVELVEEFNQEVRELRTNDRYKEEGKRELYDEKRQPVEEQLNEYRETYQSLRQDLKELFQKGKERYIEDNVKEYGIDDLTVNDFAYLQTMLSVNQSEEITSFLADKYDYNTAVMDILHAVGMPETEHPTVQEVNEIYFDCDDDLYGNTQETSEGAKEAHRRNGNVLSQLISL